MAHGCPRALLLPPLPGAQGPPSLRGCPHPAGPLGLSSPQACPPSSCAQPDEPRRASDSGRVPRGSWGPSSPLGCRQQDGCSQVAPTGSSGGPGGGSMPKAGPPGPATPWLVQPGATGRQSCGWPSRTRCLQPSLEEGGTAHYPGGQHRRPSRRTPLHKQTSSRNNGEGDPGPRPRPQSAATGRAAPDTSWGGTT